MNTYTSRAQGPKDVVALASGFDEITDFNTATDKLAPKSGF